MAKWNASSCCGDGSCGSAIRLRMACITGPSDSLRLRAVQQVWRDFRGLFADVPALMVLVLRTIHKIGYCYGYAAKTPEEDAFALQILAAASANSLQEKAGALMAMAELEQRLQAVAVSGVGTGYQESLGKETVLLLIQRLARQVGINLTKRKVLEMVPGLGALVGAAMNGNYLQDVGWTARWKFQSRWLREKYPKLQEFEKP